MRRTIYYIGMGLTFLGAMSTFAFSDNLDARLIISIILFATGLILFFSTVSEGEKLEKEMYEKDIRKTGGASYRTFDDLWN